VLSPDEFCHGAEIFIDTGFPGHVLRTVIPDAPERRVVYRVAYDVFSTGRVPETLKRCILTMINELQRSRGRCLGRHGATASNHPEESAVRLFDSTASL
jgi:hypothetical protein